MLPITSFVKNYSEYSLQSFPITHSKRRVFDETNGDLAKIQKTEMKQVGNNKKHELQNSLWRFNKEFAKNFDSTKQIQIWTQRKKRHVELLKGCLKPSKINLNSTDPIKNFSSFFKVSSVFLLTGLKYLENILKIDLSDNTVIENFLHKQNDPVIKFTLEEVAKSQFEYKSANDLRYQFISDTSFTLNREKNRHNLLLGTNLVTSWDRLSPWRQIYFINLSFGFFPREGSQRF